MYIFVTGLPRSGTTAAATILSQKLQGKLLLEQTLLHNYKNLILYYDEKDSNLFSEKELVAIRKRYNRKSGKDSNIVIDKSPGHIHRLELLNTLFPDSILVYTKRNIDDIKSSTYKKISGIDRNYERLAQKSSFRARLFTLFGKLKFLDRGIMVLPLLALDSLVRQAFNVNIIPFGPKYYGCYVDYFVKGNEFVINERIRRAAKSIEQAETLWGDRFISVDFDTLNVSLDECVEKIRQYQ